MNKLLGWQANILFGLLLSVAVAHAQDSTSVFNLAEAVRTAQAEGSCGEPTIEGKSYNATYTVAKAFNGLTISSPSNPSERWLSSFKSNNADGSCYALYRLPSDYLPSDYFILDHYTIWRANGTAGYDLARVPTRWAIFGITDNGEEVLIAEGARTLEEWGSTITTENQEQTRKATFSVENTEANACGYRAFKFVPYETASNDPVNFGICELELMVQVRQNPVIYGTYSYESSTRRLDITADPRRFASPITLALETIAPIGTTTTNTLATGVVADGTIYHYQVSPFTDDGTYQFRVVAITSSGAVVPADHQAFHLGSVDISAQGEIAAHLDQATEITVTRSPSYTDSAALIVPISYAGTARRDYHYAPTPETITIPAGAASASITITGIVHRTQTQAESITLGVSEGSYTSTNPEVTVNMLPIPESYFHWIYSGGKLTHTGDKYQTLAYLGTDNRIAITSCTLDPDYPPLYLNDPVRSPDGSKTYTIVKIAEFLDGAAIQEIHLPTTVTNIADYALQRLTSLQKLVMQCPNLQYAGWATLSGSGTAVPLRETTLDDIDLSGLEVMMGGSFNTANGISGLKGTLELPSLRVIGDNCFTGHEFTTIRLSSPDLLAISNSFHYHTIKHAYFGTTNNLVLNTKPFGNGAAIETYTFANGPQSDSNLDILTKSAADWQITINASASKGWLELPTLTSDRDAITAMLTPEEQTLYANKLNSSKLLGVITTQPTGRKVWLMQTSDAPANPPTIIFFQ